MSHEDLKLLSDEDAEPLVIKAIKQKKFMIIDLSKVSMNNAIFPRLTQIVPRNGDFGIFESTGKIVRFKGKLDSKEVNLYRSSQVPRWIKE